MGKVKHGGGSGVLVLVSLALVLITPLLSWADTTITLDQPVHFTTAEGSDMVLKSGVYTIEQADTWLRVTPSGSQSVDAILLEAHSANHEETLTGPQAISVQGESSDTHHLALLLPDGSRLEAVGSYSGIRSRGLSLLTMRQLSTLSSTTNTEFVTPTIGGSGGDRSYNLDCGSVSVIVGGIYKSGSWLDAVGLICQRVNSQTGALLDDFTRGPVGGSGGSPRMVRCPAGKVVGRAQGYTGQFVNHISFACQRWDAARKSPIIEDCRGSSCIKVGADYIGYFCPWCPENSQRFQCPSGKAGKALRGRRGIYIDNFRFVCDFWNK